MISPAKQHVAEIRRTKFSIGGEPNPLTEDLHQAVKKLSDELYAKDVHFLMELIQVLLLLHHPLFTFCSIDLLCYRLRLHLMFVDTVVNFNPYIVFDIYDFAVCKCSWR